MVTAGDTALVVNPVTNPTPWSILRKVALVTANDSRLDPPLMTVAGVAAKDTMVGGGLTGSAAVVKVKSWVAVLLPRASVLWALKWYRVDGVKPVTVTVWERVLVVLSTTVDCAPYPAVKPYSIWPLVATLVLQENWVLVAVVLAVVRLEITGRTTAAWVVALSDPDWAETFPAASKAATV